MTSNHLFSDLSQKRLVDTLVDAHLNWREACLRVSDAYRFSATQSRPGPTAAFVWYKAALDRAEDAAKLHARLVPRAGQLARRRNKPAEPFGEAA
jgi:hypothetical protein